MQYHLAIFTQPWLDLILDGQKTIDSRLTKVRCTPHGKINVGDIIYLKERVGYVKGEFTASKVETYEDLTPEMLQDLYSRYHKEIFVGLELQGFREKWLTSKYATFIHVSNVHSYENPFPFPKKDRRAWILLNKPLTDS